MLTLSAFHRRVRRYFAALLKRESRGLVTHIGAREYFLWIVIDFVAPVCIVSVPCAYVCRHRASTELLRVCLIERRCNGISL